MSIALSICESERGAGLLLLLGLAGLLLYGQERFCLPAECACTEHGCICLLEFRYEHLDFAFEHVHHILFHRLDEGTHQQVTCLGETAEDDDSLGR